MYRFFAKQRTVTVKLNPQNPQKCPISLLLFFHSSALKTDIGGEIFKLKICKILFCFQLLLGVQQKIINKKVDHKILIMENTVLAEIPRKRNKISITLLSEVPLHYHLPKSVERHLQHLLVDIPIRIFWIKYLSHPKLVHKHSNGPWLTQIFSIIVSNLDQTRSTIWMKKK